MDLDVLSRQSEEVKEYFSALNEILDYVEDALKNSKPHLNGERFLGNSEVCELLHIASRTLQEYRDKGRIAFIKLEGKILYKESDVQKMLADNYYPTFE